MYTEEEHALAEDIVVNAYRLVKFVLADDDFGLMNVLESIVSAAVSGRHIKKPQEPRRQSVRGYERKQRRYEKKSYDEPVLYEAIDTKLLEQVVALITSNTEQMKRARLNLAQNIIKHHPDVVGELKVFKTAILNVINRFKKNTSKNESFNKTTSILQDLIIELREEKDEKVKTSAPTKDRDIGEILYHLDMSTRHLDQLVDYTLIAGHEGDIVTISSAIQKLAQQLRDKLEAQRTPYNVDNDNSYK